jgi:hypothetical protein
MPIVELLKQYARRIRDLRRANPEVSEPGVAPAFQQLIAGLIENMPGAAGVTIVPEFNTPGVGRPDIALMHAGAPARAFVELKAFAKSSDPARWRDHDKRQFERFRELPCWAACNFADIRLFARADEEMAATIVPEQALRPDRDDARADRLIEAHDPQPFQRLVESLCLAAGQEPVARDAAHLADLLAHSARLVRGIARDRLAELALQGVAEHPLLQVRQEFRDVLYAHPEAGGYASEDFDDLFSGAFAQTLAFGLLLVREATDRPVGRDAWEHMPPEHPLMQTTLRVLSLREVETDIGIGFDVMRDTVNSFEPGLLAVGEDGHDPILYFYEDFLRTFDPGARERYGVYYTPVEVVRYMTSALDRALRENLGTQGLRDESVNILDPAVGTGTFLLGVAERVWSQEVAAGPGMAALALQNLASRMFAFELLVGPYAVAHYRLHHALRRPPGPGQPARELLRLPRLGIYLADTLARPGADAPIGSLGFVAQGITEERRAANRVKAQQPILAIIGNPPYRRLEEGENRTLVGDWMDDVWRDLKQPVSDAGQGGQLNTFPELSVAFWRWAIWKLFEADNAPRRGVIAFITNRKFLTGWPYAGLRQMLRQRFDRIEIVDLRGDVRRGERADVERDVGVFNIQVGTCVTLAIADGSKAEGALADVLYNDAWAEDRMSRRAKLDWLTAGAETGRLPDAVPVERGALDDMRPLPFQVGSFINLRRAFSFTKSGMKSGDDTTFVRVRRGQLPDAVSAIGSLAQGFTYDASIEREMVYRPFDNRWFYNDLRRLNRPGPDLQAAWGASNLCLYAMPGGTGAGPAVWCHGLLPDYHAFRGSYGGYAFPLHDRRKGPDAHNLAPALLAGLRRTYGREVTPQDVFDGIICLLSAASYTHRFAEDLEDVFPHVPFPADPAVFACAAALGREIRAVQTFARPPNDAFTPAGFASIADEPRGAVTPSDWNDGSLTLGEGGTGRVNGLPQPIWDYSVSGYPVLKRWIEGREGLPADLAFTREFRDVCGRIAELIDLCARADTILTDALRDSLGAPLFDAPAQDAPDA